jgi:hypothetical protein
VDLGLDGEHELEVERVRGRIGELEVELLQDTREDEMDFLPGEWPAL